VSGENVGWIALFNFVSVVAVDVVKVWFKHQIGEAAGDVIESEELLSPEGEKSEIQKHIDKQQRYHWYRRNRIRKEDLERSVEIVDNKRTFYNAFMHFRFVSATDNYVFGGARQKAAASACVRERGTGQKPPGSKDATADNDIVIDA